MFYNSIPVLGVKFFLDSSGNECVYIVCHMKSFSLQQAFLEKMCRTEFHHLVLCL